jgi:hypothetical protein
MKFSAFAPFGHFRFSGKPPVGQTIYGAMRESMGGDENLGDDSFTGPICGEMFATAMALAVVQRTVDRVNLERVPHTSNELIARHERDFRIVVPAGATMEDRRAALETAELLARGCDSVTVQDALSDLLGSALIAVRVAGPTEYVVSPANWDTTGPGNWKKAGKESKWRQLTASVDPGSYAITSTDLNGGGAFIGGDVAVIDPGLSGIQEKVTIVGSGGSTVTATFVRHHDVGANITTEPWPWAQTTSRHVLVVVTAAISHSTAWRKKIAALLGKMLRAVDTWDVVEESAPGLLGPFTVGVGMIGITPIVQMTTVP